MAAESSSASLRTRSASATSATKATSWAWWVGAESLTCTEGSISGVPTTTGAVGTEVSSGSCMCSWA